MWLVRTMQDPAGQRELDLGVVKLLDCRSAAAFASCNLLHLHDLDWVRAGTVPGPHVSVALGDSTCSGPVMVLPAHVVGTTAGVVVQPDAKLFTHRGHFSNTCHSRQFPLKISSSYLGDTKYQKGDLATTWLDACSRGVACGIWG